CLSYVTVYPPPLSFFSFSLFFFILPPPPRSTLFPYTTLFRSRLEPIPGPVNRTAQRALPLAAIAVAASQEVEATRQERDELAERSEEHTSELQSLRHLVCRLLLEKKKKKKKVTKTSKKKIQII